MKNKSKINILEDIVFDYKNIGGLHFSVLFNAVLLPLKIKNGEKWFEQFFISDYKEKLKSRDYVLSYCAMPIGLHVVPIHYFPGQYYQDKKYLEFSKFDKIINFIRKKTDICASCFHSKILHKEKFGIERCEICLCKKYVSF